MINVIIIIERTSGDSWDVSITKTIDNKIILCLESVVFKIGDVFAFEPEVSDAEKEYIKTILINQ